MASLFKNNQWAVTDFGIESVQPVPMYEINAKRLLETASRVGGILFDWPPHMAEKRGLTLRRSCKRSPRRLNCTRANTTERRIQRCSRQILRKPAAKRKPDIASRGGS